MQEVGIEKMLSHDKSVCLLFGPPGSGKGTQSMFLKEKGFSHISTGDLIRKAVREKSPLGLKAKIWGDKGELVPDELVLEFVKEALSQLPENQSIVFDGFPRSLRQAEDLELVLKEIGNRSISHVFFLDVSNDTLKQRMSGRRSCPQCSSIYHISGFKNLKKEGFCDKCSVKLIQRADDKEDIIEKKLEVYAHQIFPLRDFYSQKEILRKLDGTLKPVEISKKISEFLS